MTRHLDVLAKNLASGMTRRKALLVFGSGIAGSMALWRSGGVSQALISGDPCNQFCFEVYGDTDLTSQCLQACHAYNLNGSANNNYGRFRCPPGTTTLFFNGSYRVNGSPFPYGPFALCVPAFNPTT